MPNSPSRGSSRKSKTMMKDKRLKHYKDQSKAIKIQRSRDYEDWS